MVNNDTFLISEEVIKKQTSLHDNIENQQLRIHILEAQDIDLQSVLCEDLYAKIISGVTSLEDNGGVITDYLSVKEVKLLDDYIQPFLIYTTLYHSRHDLFLTISDRGVGALENKQGTSVSDKELSYFQGQAIDWKNNSAHYLNQIVSFLQKNIEDFPLYSECIDCDSPQKGRNSVYGLYLGKSL